MTLFAELKRRNVIRMAGLYLVVAWLLAQVVGTLLPIFEAPPWVSKTLVALLAIGFVPTLVFSWLYEMTPEGLKRDADVPPDRSIASTTGKRMDRLIVAGLVAVVALIAADRFWPRGGEEEKPGSEYSFGADDPASAGADRPKLYSDPGFSSSSTPGKKSIAVLAFADLSPAKDQEYFSDGIAEEILNALVKVKDLKVAGRTASFYYKGRNEKLKTIGEELGVAHILEGSVRKQGEKVRITAQLVQAGDGFHLWSETYDGELSDVFELQEKIARQITEQLKVVLQGDQQQRLVPVATANPEAYANFLHATAIFNRRERARFPNAIALLGEAIRLDPGFARAHARLAAFHVLSPEYTGADFDASLAMARGHANRAIELLPTLAEPHTVLAYAHGQRRELVAERESYERALAIEPDDVLSNFWYAINFARAGDLEAAERRLDRVLEIDPMLPNGLTWRGWIHVFDGDTVNARRVLERALDLGIANAHLPLSLVEHDEGDDARAIAEMELGLVAFGATLPEESPKAIAAGVFGDDAARRRAVAHVESLLASRPDTVPGPLPFALIMLGEPARALEIVQSGPTSSQIWQLALWNPRGGREARRLPQFAEFARRVGFADVWDRYGPPASCRKAANGDYVCE